MKKNKIKKLKAMLSYFVFAEKSSVQKNEQASLSEIEKKEIKKLREIFLYLFFGGATTIINISVFYVCYYYLKMSNVGGNVLAWIVSVIFAFLTNKLWVFGSKAIDKKTIVHESVMFFGCRLGTGLLDLAIMFISVNVLMQSAGIMKIIANVLVILLNYIFSKLLIFAKKK